LSRFELIVMFCYSLMIYTDTVQTTQTEQVKVQSEALSVKI